jgi:hypothetical protein
MPPGLFIDYAVKSNLEVIEHQPVRWGDYHSIDAVTLVRKP